MDMEQSAVELMAAKIPGTVNIGHCVTHSLLWVANPLQTRVSHTHTLLLRSTAGAAVVVMI